MFVLLKAHDLALALIILFTGFGLLIAQLMFSGFPSHSLIVRFLKKRMPDKIEVFNTR